MTLTVHLFARARDLVGRSHLSLDLPDGATVAELRRAMRTAVPVIDELITISAIAVNHDFAEDSHAIAASDEVALIPPVSGG